MFGLVLVSHVSLPRFGVVSLYFICYINDEIELLDIEERFVLDLGQLLTKPNPIDFLGQLFAKIKYLISNFVGQE